MNHIRTQTIKLSTIKYKPTIFESVLFVNGKHNDRSFVFENCSHLFIKGCDKHFIKNNMTPEKFPRLEYISVHDSTCDETTQYVREIIAHDNKYSKYLRMLYYEEIKYYDFYYFNKFTSIGTRNEVNR